MNSVDLGNAGYLVTVPLATHYHSPLPPPHIPLHVIMVQRFGWHPTQSFFPSQLQTTQQAYGMWTQGIFWWSMLDTVDQWTPLHFIQLSTMPVPRLVIPQPMYGGVQWTPPPCRDNGAPVTLLLRRQWAVSLLIQHLLTDHYYHLQCRKRGVEREKDVIVIRLIAHS